MADNQTGGEGAGKRRKNRDMGRNEWSRQSIDKRERLERQAEAKRRKIENGEAPEAPIYATQFSKEEIANEERRPKKKVALMLGYSGTGYYGMQLNENQKTIEGDLFSALVASGAVSKANASDPKKSSFVRCARTDKGVHAAGNVVSLKMIVEDPDIVKKINDNLSPQIRLWGYETTTGGFSCYQLCDSRVYEYLLPSHALLPPHYSTWLGKKIVELADKAGDLDDVKARQEEVAGYWEKVDEEQIRPILAKVPEDVRNIVQKAIFTNDEQDSSAAPDEVSSGMDVQAKPDESSTQPPANLESSAEPSAETGEAKPFVMDPRQQMIHDTIKSVKAAYLAAKRAYRVSPARVARLQEALNQYQGTKRFHNYTIQKSYKDQSAQRIIKSFKVNPEPILINGTEWLSLKVHGQSFMMHQIRKMVAMAALIVRSGCIPSRISETYGPERIAIPKAPGLGLLLERPIFDSYNTKATSLGREPVGFTKFTTEMEEFKQREIYDRIFREEQQSSAFNIFFNHIDHYPADYYLYVTSGGIEASKLVPAPQSTQGASRSSVKKQVDKSEHDILAAVESESEDESNLAEDR
ncbi:TRNA pseudouridine synthase [Penicillium angulare]|uniref:TRNA pseudouridine synthase n=1 Tax=Penicillium angulare TaxID=116970 RepID=UPI0025405D38|nr:TRNA pseudouridine synthase [Penicillium angulare]KAJ5261000.1 TRNA pseudouridine synthase [Penicillium angulare]